MLFKHDGVLHEYLIHQKDGAHVSIPPSFDSFFFGSNDRALIFNKIREKFKRKQRDNRKGFESTFITSTLTLHKENAVNLYDIANYINDFIEMGFIKGELNLFFLSASDIDEELIMRCRNRYFNYYLLCKINNDTISPYYHDLEIPALEFVKDQTIIERIYHPNTSGYIYLIESDNYYKIGKSKKVPKRFSSIKLLLPKKSRLVTYIKVEQYNEIERAMHSKFDHLRLNGEWFDLGKNAETLFIDAINELK